MVKESLGAAQAKSNFVRQACEGEYPKMVKLYNELWFKMKYTGAQYSNPAGQVEDVGVVGNIFVGEEMEEGLRESLTQFEHAYLVRSLSRLFDPVNLMFSGTEVPSQGRSTTSSPSCPVSSALSCRQLNFRPSTENMEDRFQSERVANSVEDASRDENEVIEDVEEEA